MQRTRHMLVYMMDMLLDIFEKEPRFKSFHLDSQTVPIQDYLEIRPEKKETVAKLIEEKKLLVGPWYCLPDEFSVGGESLIRNLLLGHKMAKDMGHVRARPMGRLRRDPDRQPLIRLVPGRQDRARLHRARRQAGVLNGDPDHGFGVGKGGVDIAGPPGLMPGRIAGRREPAFGPEVDFDQFDRVLGGGAGFGHDRRDRRADRHRPVAGQDRKGRRREDV